MIIFNDAKYYYRYKKSKENKTCGFYKKQIISESRKTLFGWM